MNKGTLASRQQKAVFSLEESISALCRLVEIDQGKALSEIRHRDPAVTQLFRLEFLAVTLNEVTAGVAGLKEFANQPIMPEEVANMVLNNVEGLTKTSVEAIRVWGGIVDSEEGSE